MSITSEPKTCSKCGGPIPMDAPEGLCPKCLLLGVSMPTEAGKGALPKGAPPTREEVAAAFPHLEILEFIGQGGMGFVFKARQPKLDRLVALKILPQSLAADPAFAERFVREGRLLARLTHPAIVAVHDFGQANGFFYLLMEYVDGVNLRQAMKLGRFTPAQALAIVPGICEALQFAHNAGILHRDIKPENILLDPKGRVKIADFGIAKLMGEPGAGETLTDRGSVLGTAHYMAPEQLEHPQDVDQRADIYSLGVVFYEMLTGELPIGRFAPPSEKSTVDPRVDEVVLRTLEKERERRTQTAGEVKTQVETIARGKVPSNPEAVWLQPEPPAGLRSRRVKMAVAAGVGFALVFVVGLVLLDRYWLGHRADSGPLTKTGVLTQAPNQLGGASNEVQEAGGIPAGPPLTKTVVLTRATNNWVGDSQEVQSVSVWTDTTVGPGEALVAQVKNPDGSLKEARDSLYIDREPGRVRTSTALSWFFGKLYTPDFGASEAEAAATQLRERMSDKPLVLTAGQPLELFAVTNQSGDVTAGYVKYVRSVPKPPERRGPSVVKPQAIVHVRRYAAYMPSMDYSVKLPPGYALRAAANVGRVSTHYSQASANTGQVSAPFPQGSKPGDYHSYWSRPPSVSSASHDFPARMQAQQAALEEQFQELLDRGPIPVVLGEPCQVFAVTNEDGGVYRGYLELVAPSGGSPTNAPRTEAAPIMPPGKAANSAPRRPAGHASVSASPAGSASTAQTARVSGRVPHLTGTRTPMLDPATGLPVPAWGPVPPGAISPPPVRLGPDGNPVPLGTTGTLTPKIGPDGMPLPPGVTNRGPRSTARDPYDLLREARELTAKAQYETALQRYLSYYDRSRISASSPPLVSALRDWVELGRKYPKAREALAEIQRRDVREFSEGRGGARLFSELAQINDALKEEEVTYVLFKALEQADQPLAKQCYLYAEGVLVRRGEYDLCLSCLGDVQRRYEIWLGTYKMEQGLMPTVRADTLAMLKKSSDDRFVDQVCRWVEILVGTGGKAEAEQLRDQTLAVLDDPRLKSAVSDAEERVRKVQASPRPALAQSALRDPTVPGPTPVNTSFTEPSASVEHWQPSLAPGQKPNLDGISGEAKVLAEGGHYEEALQRHLWYHNHVLEFDPNQRGVRLSFVLRDWVELGRKYPKAKQALLEIRDGNTRKLVEGRGSFQLFIDVDAINRQYGSEDATYALFKTVQERDPALAHRCYDLVEDLLVKKGEYALCLTCLGDYQERFASIRQDWEKGKSWEDNIAQKMRKIPSRPGAPSFVPPPHSDKQFVEETRRLIEILVNTGHKAEAGKIQERAVAALDDARLKSAVADAEKRMRN